MSAFTVYLFVRTPSDGPSSAVALRRLQALQELRDALHEISGVTVSAVPQHADLEVEITNVFATDDATHAHDARRVVVVRIAAGHERMDFVCADGLGHVTAAQQAARRICAWLESLDRSPREHHGYSPSAFGSLSTTC